MTTRKDTRPQSVPISGTLFDIVYAKKVLGGKADGLMMGPDHKIIAQSDLVGQELESLLLHEIIHGILYVSGLSELLEHDKEEAIVLAMEHGLIQLYQRIPKKLYN